MYFKLLLTTFKALHGQAPDYIRDQITPIKEYRPSTLLRSDNCMLLSIPDFNMVHYGRLALSHVAPGSAITSQWKYERMILNQNSKTNSKLICLNHIIIVRQSLSTNTDCLLLRTAPLGTLWILSLYKFYILHYYYVMASHGVNNI